MNKRRRLIVSRLRPDKTLGSQQVARNGLEEKATIDDGVEVRYREAHVDKLNADTRDLRTAWRCPKTQQPGTMI
jgi:hypothetical protein